LLAPFDKNLPLDLNPNQSNTLQEQLHEGLRRNILAGHLKPGSRLPATRQLATEQGIGRNTVLAVYEQLVAEGYLETHIGSGTFVSKDLPDQFAALEKTSEARARDAAPLSTEPQPMHTGLPAIDAFPLDIWARTSGSTARKMTAEDLQRGNPQGYGPLREAIADYLAASRNVHVSADQILIVSGLQQGLKLVADAALVPNAKIIMEDPGYAGLRRTAQNCTQTICYTPVDDHGAQTPTERGTGNLLLVSPSHQYPLGVTMPVARRLALLDWAKATNSIIFEDDYDSEFRYSSKPVSSLHGLSDGRHVIYGGSFSKATFQALRLGYLVLPLRYIEPIVRYRAAIDSFPALLPQLTLANFMKDGHFARHLRRLRKIHAERQREYVRHFTNMLGSYFTLRSADAGLNLVAIPTEKLLKKADINETDWVGFVRQAGLSALDLSGTYAAASGQEGMLLGFANFTKPQIQSRLKKLAHIMLTESGF
jgi:GntR family transcriptional regulator/MocR family aminotransferase